MRPLTDEEHTAGATETRGLKGHFIQKCTIKLILAL